MRKVLIGLMIFIVLAIVGYGLFALRSARILANYKDTNINIGAIDTGSAADMCPTMSEHRLVCLADALKAHISPELMAKLQLPYSIADARKWSNFPPIGYPDRIGPTLGEFQPDQLSLVKAILQEAAGNARNEGYDELEQILNADDYLKAHASRGAGFSSSNFHIAFLGEPSATGTWELYFGGHHLAYSYTYKNGSLAGATPSFRGVEPSTTFEMNGRTNEPMAQEQAAFAAMLSVLSTMERQQALLPQIFTDVIVGPQEDDNFPVEREGLRVGNLAPEKQAIVLAAIKTYVSDINPRDAAKILEQYQSELQETYIAYSGMSTLTTKNDYARIDGPSVWIEYSIQPGRSLPGIHPHSVWRDRRNDYAGNK